MRTQHNCCYAYARSCINSLPPLLLNIPIVASFAQGRFAAKLRPDAIGLVRDALRLDVLCNSSTSAKHTHAPAPWARPERASTSASSTIFVDAAKGTDGPTATGSITSPFRSLGRAVIASRRVVRRGLGVDVSILLRGGVYRHEHFETRHWSLYAPIP